MVLCQYYLNNRCQFGSKCHNEHFDIRQTIKSEIEAALKGTQWPLSCFGPFKEKPSLQNFITDQSFEEVRHMCYEAKKQNTFPAYSQQFNQEVMNAKNKMITMLSLSREVVDAVVNLYNSSSTPEQSVGSNQGQKSNPFAVAGGGFGAAQNNNSNSLFGNGSTAANNPFASSGFGNTAQNAGSIFGGSQSTATAGTGGSIFGQSVFGGGSNNAFGSTNNSVFGGGQPQQQQSNAFSLPQIGGAQPTSQGSNAFGMSAQTNAFGAAPTTNLFVAQNQATAQQSNNQMQSAGVFGQAAQQPQPQNLAFGQTVQPANLFVSQQPAANVFGQPNVGANTGQGVFGNNAAPLATNQQPGIFGGGQNQIQATQQQPIGFGAQPQASNVFGASQQQPQQIQQSNISAPGSAFGGGGAQTNVFQQQQQQPNTAQPYGGGSVPNMPMTGGPITDNYIPDTAYSKMEDLTPEILEAFKAPEFVLGKLPTVPPPRELC